MREVKWPQASAWAQQDRVPQVNLHEERLARENDSLMQENRDMFRELGRAKAELEELRGEYEDHLSRCAGEREG